jgi:hypothetical protein
MTRNQLRSDQLCLQVIDSVIEEQESFDANQDMNDFELGAVAKKKKDKKKQQ